MLTLLASIYLISTTPITDNRAAAEARLKERLAEYQAKTDASVEALRKARTPSEREAAQRSVPDWRTWHRDFLALERDLAGTAAGLQAATAAIRASRDAMGREAFGPGPTPAEAAVLRDRMAAMNQGFEVLTKYAAKPGFGNFCMELNSETPEWERVLRLAIKENPERSSRGHAVYFLSTTLLQRANRIRVTAGMTNRERELENRMGKEVAAKYLIGDWKSITEESIELLQTLKKDYRDIELANLRPGFHKTLGEMADARIPIHRRFLD